MSRSLTFLQASDPFLDFADFDPAIFTPHQLLGNVDSIIADGSTSVVLQLLEVTPALGAAPAAKFSSDITIQDANGNLERPADRQLNRSARTGHFNIACRRPRTVSLAAESAQAIGLLTRRASTFIT